MYRRTNRRRYVLLLVVLTSVTLITLDRRNGDSGALGAVGRVAHTVVSPIERGVGAVARPVGHWFDGVFSAGSLEDENRRLRDENARLKGEVRNGRAAVIENEAIRKATQLPILSEVPRVVARVVNPSPGNFEATVTLNRGSRDGVLEGMPVMVHDGVVGRVDQVWSDGCKVRLVTDPGFTVSVRIVEDQVTGIASGRAGADTLALDVDSSRRTPKIRRGDLVETSGFTGSTFPAGLHLGEVASVQPQQGGLPPKARVKPFVDFDRLDFVTILKWAPGLGPVTTTTTTTTTTTVPPSTVPGETTVPGQTTVPELALPTTTTGG